MAQERASIGASILGSAFKGMSNSISDALNSTESFLQSFWKFFSNFIKGMIIRLIAAAIAAFALAIALKAIGIPAGNVFKGLKDIASFKEVFGAGFKSFAGIGMAGGGVVPGGYPNDSYPAMLSSGEAVVPPGKLGAQTVNVNVSDVLLEGDMIRILFERSTEQHEAIT